MDEPTPSNELTDEQAKNLRDSAVATIMAYLNHYGDKGNNSVQGAEFALKVLDFVTG